VLNDAAALALVPPGGFLKAYVDYAVTRKDGPVIFQVGAGLALLGTVAGPSLTYNGFGRQAAPTNLYTLLVGRTGDARKSTAIEMVQELLTSELSALIGPSPGSDEGLVESLATQPNQLLLYDEFSQFLTATGTQNYLRGLRHRITAVYNCGPLQRKRVSKTTAVPWTRLNLLGGATMAHLENGTTEEDWEGGFMNRYIILLGEREKTYAELPPQTVDRSTVIALLRERYLAGQAAGNCVGRSKDAREAYGDWKASLEKVLAGKLNDLERAMLARVSVQVEKISTLVAHDLGASSEAQFKVPVEAMLPALKIGELLIETAQILGQRIAVNEAMQDERRVKDSLVEGEKVSLMVLLKRLNRYTKRQLDAILESLEARGEVVKSVDGASQKSLYCAVPATQGSMFDPSELLS
jgi:hypothetical protein